MASDVVPLDNWKVCKVPEIAFLDGQYVRLERLDVQAHSEDLYETCANASELERAKFLIFDFERSKAGFFRWLEATRNDPTLQTYVVIDKSTGRAVGRQAFMNIKTSDGCMELGYVQWSGEMARSAKSTESFFLAAEYAFEQLGYRRFEWKCDTLNIPSMNAAKRFGMTFEGIFRQHMVRHGRNRDTAWYSLIDSEWQSIKKGFQAWLDVANFDDKGQQQRTLKNCQDLARV